jgi:hypothetical protein
MTGAEKRAKREAKKEVGKRWFLHHRCRKAAISRLWESRAQVSRARSRTDRKQALKKHWGCWKELRAIEQELALHWEGDTFPSRRKKAEGAHG